MQAAVNVLLKNLIQRHAPSDERINIIKLSQNSTKICSWKDYLNMLKNLHPSMPLYICFAEMYFFAFTILLQSLISFEIDFVVCQNYNKILACDWLSPAQFEYQFDSAGVMLVTGPLN